MTTPLEPYRCGFCQRGFNDGISYADHTKGHMEPQPWIAGWNALVTERDQLRSRLALAEPTHEACSAQVESLQRQLALADQALVDAGPATVIVGVVYRTVSGSPNVRTAERLDCRNYGFEFHEALLKYEGQRVRIAIARLDETPVKGANGQPAPVVQSDP